jgi:hypothetical protein
VKPPIHAINSTTNKIVQMLIYVSLSWRPAALSQAKRRRFFRLGELTKRRFGYEIAIDSRLLASKRRVSSRHAVRQLGEECRARPDECGLLRYTQGLIISSKSVIEPLLRVMSDCVAISSRMRRSKRNRTPLIERCAKPASRCQGGIGENEPMDRWPLHVCK